MCFCLQDHICITSNYNLNYYYCFLGCHHADKAMPQRSTTEIIHAAFEFL